MFDEQGAGVAIVISSCWVVTEEFTLLSSLNQKRKKMLDMARRTQTLYELEVLN